MKSRTLFGVIIVTLVALAIFIGCSKSDKTEQAQTVKEQVYTCPMHPQVVSNEPGQCPICNMDLVLKKDAAVASEQPMADTTKITYTCPMHPEVVSNEPGLCPKCNMKLIPQSADKEEMMDQNMDSTKTVYTCPMHPEVVADEPGLCPKCNMHLEPKQEAHEEHGMKMDESSPVQYTCGMHPQIISDEPGNCPICNMKLVVKSDVSSSGGAIMVDAETSKKMGIATMPASFRKLSKTVRAYGNVTYSEPDVYTVNVKIAGWVEKLLVNESGMKVKKDQPLMEIYSPELIAAQQEYLIALKTREAMQTDETVPNRMISASYSKLKNWDISDEQINQLITSKRITRTLVFKSPFDGVVTMKNVNEGDYVTPGRDLYKVANLSSVWVSAYVYEQDLPLISEGLIAQVSSPSLPGDEFESEVIYVSPFLDQSKQAEIRLSVENKQMKLKPNMYAEINIMSQIGSENLSVPRSAIVKSGTREVLFVATGKNIFEPREIHTGNVADNDFVEVLHGVNAGDNVVVSGQFMLDSESRLNEVIAGMTHSH